MEHGGKSVAREELGHSQTHGETDKDPMFFKQWMLTGETTRDSGHQQRQKPVEGRASADRAGPKAPVVKPNAASHNV